MNKTVLITGVSRGIGFALANLLLEKGYHLVGTSRTGEAAGLAHPNIEMLPLNLADMASIRHAGEYLYNKGTKIDILLNNAAIGPDLDTFLPDEESFRETFETNVTGTVFFTEVMLACLNKDASIINISSKMGSLAVCKDADSVAYRMSKAALNMYSKILANRLRGKHTVATVHPGWVRTTLTAANKNAPLSQEESAASILAMIESNFKTGIYWNAPEKAEIEW